MATNEVPRGPVSAYVVGNVKRLRADRRWSLAELSDQMRKVGKPMLASGLHRLEQGNRRIDCDDLIALAAAFGVAPITMLLPWTADGQVQITESIASDALAAWDWIRGLRPLDLPTSDEGAYYATAEFRKHAVPAVVRFREEGDEQVLTRSMGAQRVYMQHLQELADQQSKTIKLLNEQLEERTTWLTRRVSDSAPANDQVGRSATGGGSDGEHQEAP